MSARPVDPPTASTSAREELRGPRRVCAVLTGSGCGTGPVHLIHAARSRPPRQVDLGRRPGVERGSSPRGGPSRFDAALGSGKTWRLPGIRQEDPRVARMRRGLPPPRGADRRRVVDFTHVPTRYRALAARPSSRGRGPCATAASTGRATSSRTGRRQRGRRPRAGDPGAQALRRRRPSGARHHHSDHGSQYLSIAHAGRLVDEGIEASAGAVGSSLRGRRRPGPGQTPASAGPVWRDCPW